MTRVWAGRQGAAAIVVVLVTALWRGLLLKGSYFNQDDYYLTTRAYHRSGLGWHFLFEPVAGHVQPAQQLCYWLVAKYAAFDWGAVASAILVTELLTVIVMWHLLSRLLPGRWVRVPLLAVFAWSPLTLVPTLWWSAAMGLWPPMLFLLLATLFLVRAQQHAGSPAVDLALSLAFFLVGLSWHERGILTVIVLAGVALARSPRTGFRRVTDVLTRWWGLWVPLAALTLGYLLLHRTLTSVAVRHATLGDRVDIARAFVLRNTIPGIASGPWQSHTAGGAIVPAHWVVLVSGALAVVALLAIVRAGGRGRGAAVLMLVVYVAVDLVLLLLGRGGFGEIIGLDPRYTADVTAAAVVFTALALEGGRRPTGRWLPAAAAGSALVYLACAGLTTAHLATTFQNHDDRTFMTNLRAGLARDPQVVLLDRPVPPEILLPLLGKEALLSSVLAPLPEHPVFDVPSADLRAVATDGRLVPVRIVPVAADAPGAAGACGHAVSTGTTSIALEPATPLSGRVVLHLAAFTDRDADYEIGAGSWSGTLHAVRGPQEIWVVVPDHAGRFSSLSFTGTGPATLCVVHVQAGPPVDQP